MATVNINCKRAHTSLILIEITAADYEGYPLGAPGSQGSRPGAARGGLGFEQCSFYSASGRGKPFGRFGTPAGDLRHPPATAGAERRPKWFPCP